MAEYGKEIFSMKIKILFLIFCCIYWKTGLTQTPKPFAVVELFTSEGCNTCPPAEKLFSEMKADAEKNHKNIFFLEYHVDYWNKLGWKDPYSSFPNTLRQKNYVSVLNEESLYTPMMIVNGSTSFTGSDAEKAKSATATALVAAESLQLKVKIDSIANDTLFVSYHTSKADKNYFVRFAVTENNLISTITKGENSGKTLTHDNVVRIFFSGEVKGLAAQLKVPLKKFTPNKNCELVSFIQQKQTMKILAVTKEKF
ncbi:thioredoxin family protein [soil metagenome]